MILSLSYIIRIYSSFLLLPFVCLFVCLRIRINGLLQKLSEDEDMHDDLKTNPIVHVGLKHWTGERRLPSQEAQKLQSNERAMYVFKRFAVH